MMKLHLCSVGVLWHTTNQMKNSSILDKISLTDRLGLDVSGFPGGACLPHGQVQPYNTTRLQTRLTAILSATH